MQSASFALVQCWKNERIGQVINKEATSVDTATFLATHLPLNNLVYQRSPQSISDTSENGLLQELRNCAEQDRHAFVIVQGIPGTGKSHLIRWLKESYIAEADQRRERVLFIERAQCSLRSTLEQIIKSGIFDKEAMKEQLEKLDGARIELSKEALSTTLLGQLQVAIGETPQLEMPNWLARKNRLEKYLLDFVVRRELTKPDGPIDRIVRFLRSGSGMQSREIPRFEESDFIFKAAVLWEIEGYEEAKYVAEYLQGEENTERRHNLVAYLNQLLPFAIGHATALTSDDFKQIFYDLRRYLHRQNQTLTLFIEDITALTGIDTGLLDVLATQHMGGDNQDFCRIASVVGITDNYFMDYFPDNMKDRVTHRLTLNATQTNVSDTELLVNSKATSDLAARYLNAMRLEQKDLDEWLSQGGKPTQFPNACMNCKFKTTCHSAFGAYNVQLDNENEQDIGLYPFNERAIWTLYQHINTSSSKRTPRSLLNNVLYYIMQSHGTQTAHDNFPPASSELGNEFTTFSLAKMQHNVLASQGGNDARRIETLVTIWGNGTIDAEQIGAEKLVGGLLPEVFQAFGIKPIAGEQIAHPILSRPTQKNITPPPISLTTNATTYLQKEGKETENTPVTVNLPKSKTQSKYVKDITEWSRGGKLVYYTEYHDLLVPLLRSFIDWDFYQINDTQLDKTLRRQRIHIERQEGKMKVSHYLTLKYNPELMAVLLSLVEIKENGREMADAVLSGCLSNFSIWLHTHEKEVVQFVQQPHLLVDDLLPLNEMLLFTCLILACLQGALQSSYKSTQDLWLDLVSFCVSTRDSSAEWEQLQQRVRQQHSHTWAGLVTQISSKRVSSLCSLLLSVLNCSQGGSSEVRFLDAPTALHLIKRLDDNDWLLTPTTPLDAAAIMPWDEVVATYTTLQKQFVSALSDDCAVIQDALTRLSSFADSASPKEAFQSMQTFVKVMADTQRGTKFAIKQPLSMTRFVNMQTRLHSTLKEKKQGQLALLLSNIGEMQFLAQEYITYFDEFVKTATEMKEANIQRLAQLQGSEASESISELEAIRSMYQEIVRSLDVQKVEEEKV